MNTTSTAPASATSIATGAASNVRYITNIWMRRMTRDKCRRAGVHSRPLGFTPQIKKTPQNANKRAFRPAADLPSK